MPIEAVDCQYVRCVCPCQRCFFSAMKQIHLDYIDAVFSLSFEHPFSFFTAPSFVFRSILGSQLHSIACIARQNICKTCQFNRSCIYAVIFETILDKNTAFLAGRDKGSHPFRIQTDTPFQIRMPMTELRLTIQLYGFAIQYLPYIFYAIQQAGKQGLFKDRTRYRVSSVKAAGQELLQADENLHTVYEPSSVSYDYKGEAEETAAVVPVHKTIHLCSPLRFKTSGKYTLSFSAQDFLLCIHRRLVTLCSLYGSYTPAAYTPSADARITAKKLSWLDYQYHSHRQEKIISMGGATGLFTLIGNITAYEQFLLSFADIFGAGKNTNFGLGDVRVV